MKPLSSEKSGKCCKRCFKNLSVDIICPACKSDLIALYDNKLTWRTAFEIEKISRNALRYTGNEAEEEYN